MNLLVRITTCKNKQKIWANFKVQQLKKEMHFHFINLLEDEISSLIFDSNCKIFNYGNINYTSGK